jgi:hypothetical protein
MATAQDPQNYDQLQEKLQNLQQQLRDLELSKAAKAEEAKPLYTVFSWEGPDRIVEPKTRAWYVTVGLLFMVGVVFATLVREILLMIALIAVMTLVFLAQVVKPSLVKHEITNKGLRTDDKIFYWNLISGFWISRRGRQYLLVVHVNQPDSPSRLMLPLGGADPAKLIQTLLPHANYLNQNEVAENFINIFSLGEYQQLSNWIKIAKNEAEKPNEKTAN